MSVTARASDSALASDSGLELEPELAPGPELGLVTGLDSRVPAPVLADSAVQASESARVRRHPPERTALWPEQ